MAELEKLKFGPTDYLTDGKRLVRVEMILPDGDVLVNDARTGYDEHMPSAELQEWFTPDEWEDQRAA